MNEANTVLVEASIKLWEHKATTPDYFDIHMGPETCPLCKVFYDKDCQGCPIRDKTGRIQCYDTPYTEAYKLWEYLTDAETPNQIKVRRPKYRKAAREMVQFLKDLL